MIFFNCVNTKLKRSSKINFCFRTASLGGKGLNRYQEKIDKISIVYLTHFSRISKISAGYTWILDTSGLWSNSNKHEKSLKTAMLQLNPTAGYQPDINGFFLVHRIS